MNILIATSGNITRGEVSLLSNALNKNHKVTIASMASDKGHQGMSFSTSGHPSRVDRFSYKDAMRNKTSSVDGFSGIMVHEFYSNPADAIAVMLCEVMKHDLPDIVICGISNGTNFGPDIYSSSHVNMALEATFYGVRAISIATEYCPGGNKETHLKNVIKFLESNLEELATVKLPHRTFLNINVPRVDRYKQLKGVKFVPMGRSGKVIEFDERKISHEDVYYWMRFAKEKNDKSQNDDRAAFEAGFVAITPLNYDATGEV